MTDDYFVYGDLIVTIERDGIKQEYKMSEDIGYDFQVEGASFDCRVLDFPEFEYKESMKVFR